MMSERPGVPGRARGWENRQPQPAPCRCQQQLQILPSWLVCKSPSSSETLCNAWMESSLTGPAGVCWGKGARPPPRASRLPPPNQAWPGLLPSFTSGLEAGSPSRLAAPRPTSFSRPVVLRPGAPGFHFWVWGASLCFPLSCRSSHRTTMPPKRKECVGVGGCFQFYSI